MVTEAARAGDTLALRAFAEVGDWLGVGLANLVAAFDPQVVVIGGGVSASDDLLLDPARAALQRSLVGASHRVVPPILRARFGAESGVVGGAAMAREVIERSARRGRSRRRRTVAATAALTSRGTATKGYSRAPSSQGSSGERGRWRTR
jgi:glucokinase